MFNNIFIAYKRLFAITLVLFFTSLGAFAAENATPDYTSAQSTSTLQDLHNALESMQKEYFTLWAGKWATAIDWTAAVIGTHLSATLSSLSHSVSYTMPGTFDKSRKLDVEAQMVENEINKYFSQTITFFFGEEQFAIRNQAFDDMLWVVLGWLESIQFIDNHSKTHYSSSMSDISNENEKEELQWHAQQFIPAFAHRARIFYELASKGWDWELCGGGMNWNPRLLPYKNAITNQLWISASIEMYLHFPGDDNCSPFMSAESTQQNLRYQADPASFVPLGCSSSSPGTTTTSTTNSTYDTTYLRNAVIGYDWLKNSHMLNSYGLYADGFHIKDYASNHSKTECNERNEMVYTYNQGVILSGLRGLWEATGNVTYLEDGHALIRNVVRATGYKGGDMELELSFDDLQSEPASPPEQQQNQEDSYPLGANGILEETCDPTSTCSQDGQTFKSIYFAHLVKFCVPLPSSPVAPGKTFFASKEIAILHQRACKAYTGWVVRNGRAALRTRDEKGRFGGWWGVSTTAVGEGEGEREGAREYYERKQTSNSLLKNAIDYRNDPTLYHEEHSSNARSNSYNTKTEPRSNDPNDPNDRGRGRTVETQAGGLAVVRAMWEFLRLYDGER